MTDAPYRFTLFLMVNKDGRVQATIYSNNINGAPHGPGQTFMRTGWHDTLAAINPMPNTRVIVRPY